MALIPRNVPSAEELARRGVGVEKPQAKPTAKKVKKQTEEG